MKTEYRSVWDADMYEKQTAHFTYLSIYEILLKYLTRACYETK